MMPGNPSVNSSTIAIPTVVALRPVSRDARVGEHNEALLKPMLGAAEYDKLCASGAISDGTNPGKKKK